MSKRLDRVRQNVENLIERTGEVGIAFDYACFELGDIDTANRLVRYVRRRTFGHTLLTRREETVLLMLACGYRTGGIAKRIYAIRNVNAVYAHLERIYAKLNTSTQTGAVVQALLLGIITLEQIRKLTISENYP